jgi:HK97 family phage portal protein
MARIRSDRPQLKIFTGQGGSGSRRSSLLPGARYDWQAEAGDLYLNDVVSLAVNWVADKINMVPLVVHERQPDDTFTPIFDNALAELWAKNNEDYDAYTRDLAVGMSLITSGNAFLYIQRGGLGKLPTGLYWLDERFMYPVYPTDGSRYIDGWHYRIDGVSEFLPKEDVLHFRWGIDPLNTRLGLSKLKAVLRQVCLLNEAAGYSVSILKNSGVPGMVVTPADDDDELTDDDGLAIKSSLNKMTRGDARGSTIAVNRRIKLETVGFSPEQMSLDKLPHNAMPLVCGAIGVPPEVLGLPSATKTYDNYATAKRSAWESGVMPLLKLMRETITRKLMPEFGFDPRRYRLDHDMTDVQDLQENADAVHKRALEAYLAGTITLNMFLEETGRTGDVVVGDRYKYEIDRDAAVGQAVEPGGNLFG